MHRYPEPPLIAPHVWQFDGFDHVDRISTLIKSIMATQIQDSPFEPLEQWVEGAS